MSEDVFTDPDDERPAHPDDPDRADDDETRPANGDWADVRMTDPDVGEWNVDAVVVDGRVEYVDLQVRPDLLAGFVSCLLDDVSDERAEQILTDVATRQGIDSSGELASE